MHSWTSPNQGLTPGAGCTPPPEIQWGLKMFSKYHFEQCQQFCKNNFVLKCIPEPIPIRVLPLGQGGCPPEVQWGRKYF